MQQFEEYQGGTKLYKAVRMTNSVKMSHPKIAAAKYTITPRKPIEQIVALAIK